MSGSPPATSERPAPAGRTDDGLDSATTLDVGSPVPPRKQDHEAANPDVMGPYALVERIGAGGMGVVYRAHDPRLDREVALKVMRTPAVLRRPAAATRERLLREARALARLHHPNVVEVYDVGFAQGRVFIAMELVAGQTLTQWLATAPSHAQILEHFAAAGRGLLAAHNSGLVHRDFKPENVLVGDDGRVRVMDFGLARATSATGGSQPSVPPLVDAPEHDPPELDPPELSPHDHAHSDHTALTGAGVVMGTPRYMAPEQHYGEATDARTDQYAFCVALYEAVTGGRAFQGSSPRELAAAKHEQRFADPSRHAALPRALRTTLLRGLCAQPQGRYADLRPVLAVLDASRTRRRYRRVAGAVGTLAAVGAVVVVGRPPPPSPCASAAGAIDAIWGPSQRDAATAALVASALPYADDSAARLVDHFDRYAQRWRASRHQACMARRAQGVSVDDPPDARTRCLARRRAEFEGVVALFTAAQPDASPSALAPALVEQAVPIALSLSPPQRCTQDAASAADGPVPPDHDTLQAWLDLTRRVARISAQAVAGQQRAALDDAHAVLRDAQAHGWPPLRARALLAVGDASLANEKIDAARDAYTTAYWLAQEQGLDALGLQAAIELVFLFAEDRLDATEATRWAGHARSQAERTNNPDAHARIAAAMGVLHQTQGNIRLAAQAYAQAREHYARTDGPRSHNVALMLNNLGTAHQALGEYEQSLEEQTTALQILMQTLGSGHPSVATVRENLASTMSRLGRLDAAIDELNQVVVLRRAVSGNDSLDTARALTNLGAMQTEASHPQDAIHSHRDAEAIYAATLPASHPHRIANRVNLGLALVYGGAPAEALTIATDALTQLQRSAPHPFEVYAHMVAAAAHLQLNDAQAAQVSARRGVTECNAGATVEPAACAQLHGLLARAQWQTDPEGRDGALAMARMASATLGTKSASARRLHAWLSTVGGER